MKINIKLNQNKYAIAVESNCFTAIKFGVNSDNESKNFGQETSKDLGYFSTLPNACKRLIREELSQDDTEVSLNEFLRSYEAVTKQMTEQLNTINA